MEQKNMKFYITFGSNEQFPYQNGYLTIEAPDCLMARNAFPQKYPNRPGSDCLNFSFIYSEEEWTTKRDGKAPCDYYTGQDPYDELIVGEDGKLIQENGVER